MGEGKGEDQTRAQARTHARTHTHTALGGGGGGREKTVQLPFPTVFLGADEEEGIIGNFNSARFDSVRR